MTQSENPPPRLVARTYAEILICVLGALFRVREYVACRSLWLDEASLALNIIERTPQGLLAPLDHAQGAPVLFLLAQKMMVTLLGTGELALRALPLMAGVASLLVFWRVCRSVLDGPARLVTLLLFSLLNPLVYYSGECKQYSTDVLAVVLILWMFTHIERRPSRLRLAGLAALGVTVMALSHAVVFVLAGVATSLLWSARRENRPGPVIAMVCSWLAALVILYSISLRHLAARSDLTDYWRDALLPFPPRSLSDLAWLYRHATEFFVFPCGFRSVSSLALVLAVLGAFAWLDRRRSWFLFGAGTLASACVASASGKYPLEGRLLLFLVPVALLSIGNAIEDIGRGCSRRTLGVVVALLVAEPSYVALRLAAQPGKVEELRSVLDHVVENSTKGDLLIVSSSGTNPFTYYWHHSKLDLSNLRGPLVESSPATIVTRGSGRTWIVASHLEPSSRSELEAALGAGARCLGQFEDVGAVAWLYEFPPR